MSEFKRSQSLAEKAEEMSASLEHPSTIGALDPLRLEDKVMLCTSFQKSLCLDWESAIPSLSLIIYSHCLCSLRASYLQRFLVFFLIWKSTPEVGWPHSVQTLCQKAAACRRNRAWVFHPGTTLFLVLALGIYKSATVKMHSSNWRQSESSAVKWDWHLGWQQEKTSSGITGKWSWINSL